MLIASLFLLNQPCHGVTVRDYDPGVTFLGTPYYYDAAYYGHNNRGKITQMNLKGQKVWELEQTTSAWEFIGIKFNQLFVLDTDRKLHIIDAKKGYNKFTPDIAPIKKINLRYPTIPILTQNNKSIGLDFFTGNPVEISKDKWTRLMSKEPLNPSVPSTNVKYLKSQEKECTLISENAVSQKTNVVLCKEALYWVIE
ncbi:MAG: hypothetical protein O3A01_05800 [bacterium]|nr:hypothetical protein [bacterium]